MDNFTKILTTIRRPFQQELRKGCKDDVVVNGLGSYVQLWAKNGDAFVLDTTQKEVLNGLANLFENYAGASSSERQRILEEATKRIDAILGSAQYTTTDIGDAGVEPSPKRQQPTLQRPTSSKKNTQAETLPLFEGIETSSKNAPTKREPTTHTTQTDYLSFLQDTEAAPQQAENTPTEEIEESVPVSDTPVGTDITSLDFLSEPLHYLKLSLIHI